MKHIYTLQSHKEFVERKKRLEIASAFDTQQDEQRNIINDIDDEIEKLELEIQQKKLAREHAVNKIDEIGRQKLEKMTAIYNQELLNEIACFAENTSYSESSREEIKELANQGRINIDNFDTSYMNKVLKAEITINNEIPKISRIKEFMNDIGGSFSLPGEEE